jgi:hypothetical protein
MRHRKLQLLAEKKARPAPVLVLLEVHALQAAWLYEVK